MWWLWILNGIYISLLRRLFDIDILIIHKINIRIECVNRINYCMRWILCGGMRVRWLWCLLSLCFSFKSLKVFMSKQRKDIKCVACGVPSEVKGNFMFPVRVICGNHIWISHAHTKPQNIYNTTTQTHNSQAHHPKLCFRITATMKII